MEVIFCYSNLSGTHHASSNSPFNVNSLIVVDITSGGGLYSKRNPRNECVFIAHGICKYSNFRHTSLTAFI